MSNDLPNVKLQRTMPQADPKTDSWRKHNFATQHRPFRFFLEWYFMREGETTLRK